MMKAIWKAVDRLPFQKVNKQRIFLLIHALAWGVIGYAVWWCIHFWMLDSWDWTACFIGYPACFIGILGGVFFLFRIHDHGGVK